MLLYLPILLYHYNYSTGQENSTNKEQNTITEKYIVIESGTHLGF